jgi:hypothetical protein
MASVLQSAAARWDNRNSNLFIRCMHAEQPDGVIDRSHAVMKAVYDHTKSPRVEHTPVGRVRGNCGTSSTPGLAHTRVPAADTVSLLQHCQQFVHNAIGGIVARQLDDAINPLQLLSLE